MNVNTLNSELCLLSNACVWEVTVPLVFCLGGQTHTSRLSSPFLARKGALRFFIVNKNILINMVVTVVCDGFLALNMHEKEREY